MPDRKDGEQPTPTEEEERISREPGKDFEMDPKGEEPGHSSDEK
jgi:hypothetical protein